MDLRGGEGGGEEGLKGVLCKKFVLIRSLLILTLFGLLSGCGSYGPPPQVTYFGTAAGTNTSKIDPYSTIELRFTPLMNHESLLGAIKVIGPGGEVPIDIYLDDRVFYDETRVFIDAKNDWDYSKQYKVIVDRSAKTKDGVPLAQGFEGAFSIRESRRIRFDSFYVTRYTDAQMTATFTNLETYPLYDVQITVTCKEDGYPSLYTSFNFAFAAIGANNSVTQTQYYSDGFPYFTSNTVHCTFDAKANGGDADEVY